VSESESELASNKARERACELALERDIEEENALARALSLCPCVLFLCFALFLFPAIACVLFLYRVARTHRMPYLHRSFSAEEPYD